MRVRRGKKPPIHSWRGGSDRGHNSRGMAKKSGESGESGEADFFNKLVQEQASEQAPPATFADAKLSEQAKRVLATLTPREEAILRMRFGIGESDPAKEEVGQDFEVTRARIREIEEKALARLRDPKNSAALAPFIESDDNGDDRDDDGDD